MTPIKRAPFGAVSGNTRVKSSPIYCTASDSSSLFSPSQQQQAQKTTVSRSGGVDGARRKNLPAGARGQSRQSTTAITMTPPTGLQFLTVFKCKYYGSGTLGHQESQGPLNSKCTELVRRVVAANNRQHAPAVLQITDQGIQLQRKGYGEEAFVLDVEELQNVVPGTIKCKSGKQLRIALIVERSTTDSDCSIYHVIQFRHSDDLRHLAESTKRMWRDHMFTALLDVSTEEGQNAFDSFSIERDIEMVNTRCSKLIATETYEFERALEGLLGHN